MRRQSAATCQVEGCPAILTNLRSYFLRQKICEEHARASTVPDGRGGFLRFCQQCTKLEPVTAFEGTKRSCRASLAKRHDRHRLYGKRGSGDAYTQLNLRHRTVGWRWGDGGGSASPGSTESEQMASTVAPTRVHLPQQLAPPPLPLPAVGPHMVPPFPQRMAPSPPTQGDACALSDLQQLLTLLSSGALHAAVPNWQSISMLPGGSSSSNHSAVSIAGSLLGQPLGPLLVALRAAAGTATPPPASTLPPPPAAALLQAMMPAGGGPHEVRELLQLLQLLQGAQAQVCQRLEGLARSSAVQPHELVKIASVVAPAAQLDQRPAPSPKLSLLTQGQQQLQQQALAAAVAAAMVQASNPLPASVDSGQRQQQQLGTQQPSVPSLLRGSSQQLVQLPPLLDSLNSLLQVLACQPTLPLGSLFNSADAAQLLAAVGAGPGAPNVDAKQKDCHFESGSPVPCPHGCIPIPSASAHP